MFKSILVPIDLADTDLAKPAIATAATLSETWSGAVRLLNVLPMTPVMLAEYVPADFDTQQRQTSEEALAIVARESGIEPSRVSYAVRQGGIYHEILEEATAIKAELIVMTSHRPAMRTYFLGSNAGHVVRYAKCSVLVVDSARIEDEAFLDVHATAPLTHTASSSTEPCQLRVQGPVHRRLDLGAHDADIAQGAVVEPAQRFDGDAAVPVGDERVSPSLDPAGQSA